MNKVYAKSKIKVYNKSILLKKNSFYIILIKVHT